MNGLTDMDLYVQQQASASACLIRIKQYALSIKQGTDATLLQHLPNKTSKHSEGQAAVSLQQLRVAALSWDTDLSSGLLLHKKSSDPPAREPISEHLLQNLQQ